MDPGSIPGGRSAGQPHLVPQKQDAAALPPSDSELLYPVAVVDDFELFCLCRRRRLRAVLPGKPGRRGTLRHPQSQLTARAFRQNRSREKGREGKQCFPSRPFSHSPARRHTALQRQHLSSPYGDWQGGHPLAPPEALFIPFCVSRFPTTYPDTQPHKRRTPDPPVNQYPTATHRGGSAWVAW